MVLEAMANFQGHLKGTDLTSFSVATKMVQQMQDCRPVGAELDKEAVIATLGSLADQGKHPSTG